MTDESTAVSIGLGKHVTADVTDRNVRWQLFLASALLLFVELALIRWLGANVIHLSYFSNFVLLGSFLGAGIGFLRARSPRNLTWISPILLAALVVFVRAVPVRVNQNSSQILYFTNIEPTGLPVWVTLPIIFLSSAAIIAGIGELVGRRFLRLPALDAYRLDLLGSLTGIIVFSLLSFMGAPSVVWGVLASLGFLVLLRPRLNIAVASSLVVIVACLGLEGFAAGVSWSPYYKIVTHQRTVDGETVTDVSANGVPHQVIESSTIRLRYEPIYDMPYQRLPDNSLDRVLIIGAGNGADTALALKNGAKRVDAVEIDPRLRNLGKKYNPDHPYDDPRVHVHINDGRAFLQQSDDTYDLILFALPDSLTLVSGASSIRLESYLFTKQAIEAAREHLAPGGGFAMYNYYRQTWLVNRYAETLKEAFAHSPCIDKVGDYLQQAVLAVGLEQSDQQCRTTWSAAAADTPKPVSDDRPFPYLRTPSIPKLYLFVLGSILLVSLLAVLPFLPSRRSVRRYADLFFMGTAFLLLETKNVTTFALFFGTTWFVNAIVFAGVLIAVLGAVETARRLKRVNLPLTYTLLLGSLAVAWFIPASWLLDLGAVPRAAAAIAIAFAPIYLANLAFSERLRTVEEPTIAFGLNLLGAMVGGCLEYAALVIGYRDLLLVVAGIYGLAFVLYRGVRDKPALTGP